MLSLEDRELCAVLYNLNCSMFRRCFLCSTTSQGRQCCLDICARSGPIPDCHTIIDNLGLSHYCRFQPVSFSTSEGSSHPITGAMARASIVCMCDLHCINHGGGAFMVSFITGFTKPGEDSRASSSSRQRECQ